MTGSVTMGVEMEPVQRRRVNGARAITILAVAWFALWACAPPSVVAPMVPLDKERGWDLGLAGGGGVVIATDGSEGALAVGDTQLAPVGSGQVWLVKNLGTKDFGVSIGGETSTDSVPLYGGVMLRQHFIERDDLAVGLDMQLGWLWTSVGLPVSMRLSDRVWVYTDPSLGYRMKGVVRVPVGMSVQVADHLRLNTELGVHALDQGTESPDNWLSGLVRGPTVTGSVGLSYRP